MVHELARPLLLLVGTYLIHSTLLLGGTWLILRWWSLPTHRLREQLWKLAAVAPLVTTAVQWSLGTGGLPIVLSLDERPTRVAQDGPELEPTAGRHEPITSSTMRHGASSRSGDAPRIFAAAFRGLSQPQNHVSTEDKPAAARDDGQATRDRILRASGAGQALAQVAEDEDADDRASITDVGFLSLLLLSITVLIGMGGVCRFVVASGTFRRRLSRCDPYDGPARPLLDRLLAQTPCPRSVQLMVWDTEGEPAAMGIVHWRIILPQSADQRLPKEDLRAMLAHELAHLVRGDPWWQWVGRVLCAVAAFQPLNFVAWRQWRRAAEYQCDAWAVGLGVGRLSLARCLTSIAEWRYSQSLPEAVLAGCGAPGDLTDRVERLLGKAPLAPTKERAPGMTGAAGMVALVAVLCFILPGMQTHGEAPLDLPPQPRGSVADQPPTEMVAVPADREIGRQAVIEELLVLDREIRALRAAANELQSRSQDATSPPSHQMLTHRVTFRLETIDVRRNELARLAQCLTNERTER
ncbi:MAG: M56 family metallopeptidase [Pirellulaceae bacterium]